MCPSTQLSDARELAERLRGILAVHEFEIDRRVSASFGVAQAVQGEARESLLDRADAAMYRAKNSGRDRVVACQ